MTAANGRPQPQLAPTPVFVTGFVLAAHVHSITPAVLPAHRLSLSVGLLLMAAGVGVFVWSVTLFTRASTGVLLHRPANALIVQGPYGWSRNPQYVAFVGIYIGLALTLNTLWPLVVLPAVTVAITRTVIMPEERYLRQVFGQAYDAYCAQVKRWL